MEFKPKESTRPGLREKVLFEIKKQQSRIVANSHWGRSYTYKQLIHISIIAITIGVFASGLNARATTANNEIQYASAASYTNVDTLQQGAFIETQVSVTGSLNFSFSEYTVQPGDSVQSIADQFAISKDTLKWANAIIDYYSEAIDAGTKLVVPEIDGVLYQVQEGDTLDSVLEKTSGDRFQVVEINQLLGPEFKLATGIRILVPGGKLEIAPPPAPEPAQGQTYYYYTGPAVDVSALAGISFINPMGACGGYTESRGYLPWHNGVDLSGAYGCPIVAAAAGVVDYVGWSNWGEGNMVRIYHGNGVYTSYYHGSGFGPISLGQQVNAGDLIMYEGSTGNSTGPHLHFGLRLGAYDFIDPRPYVPW